MKKLEQWLKYFLVFLIKLLLPRRNQKKNNDDWHNFKQVLVFRLDNRLGNSILILSLVQSIKKSLPDVDIDVLMTSSYVEFYQNHPDIHKIIPYDQKYLFRNPIRFLFLINQLRKNKYDIVFSSNNPDAFSVSQAIFNRLVSQNRSVGFDWKDSARLYSDVVTGDITIHYAQAQYDLWRYFDNSAEYSLPKLYFMNKYKVPPEHSLLIWLGATGNKFLPEGLVDSIIMAIKELDVDFSLAVGPEDLHVIDYYRKPWRDDIKVMSLDLRGIAEFFLNYKCIVIPDTGPMHLVAAMGIPLIQVFVNSSIEQYGYLGYNKYIIDKKIDADSLKQFVREQLNSTPQW
jgi:heptosyltransferase-3